MRPLLIVFSNLGLGGIQKKIVDIVNMLADTNPDLRIYILLRRHDIFDLTDKIRNPNVTLINYTDWAKVKTPFFFTFFLIYQVARLNPRAILSFLSAFSIPSIMSKIIFFWRDITVVVNEDHYTSGIVPHLRYSKLNYLGIKLLYQSADQIISPTKMAKKDLVVKFGIPSKNIKIVPNWSNLADRKLKKTRKIYDLVYAGRLVKTKRVHLTLKGIAKLKKHKKNIKFCLLGDGDEKDNLKNLAQKLDVEGNVDFLGARKDISRYLAKSKLFVCYSQFGAEGFPLAILEAMAMGIPVLTYKFAGVGDVISDGRTGKVFSSMNEFIEKVLWLLDNPDKRDEIARKAKAKVESDHSFKNIEEYLKALRV